MKLSTRFVVIITSALLCVPRVDAQAPGGVIVLSSTLITVEGHERAVSVRASNNSDHPQRYRVALGDMVMGEDGELSFPGDEDTALEHTASSWVIATPRSMELSPGESQTIRLLIRRPADLEDGEYRTHLRITQEPPPDSDGGLDAEVGAGRIGFQLTTVYSLSVPVVVKQGDLAVSARLQEAGFDDSGRLALTVSREGNAAFRGFAHAVSGSVVVRYPVIIYRERDDVRLAFPLRELEGATQPIRISIHEGSLRSEPPSPSELAGAVTVRRPEANALVLGSSL